MLQCSLYYIVWECFDICCKTKLKWIKVQKHPKQCRSIINMTCFWFLSNDLFSFENTFKVKNELHCNLKAQQMCIINCSLWIGKRVDIEHWSLKLQFCCSIIHDTTEWYILATGLCDQRPPWELPPLHFSAAGKHIIEFKCSVNDTQLWENSKWNNMCDDSCWMNFLHSQMIYQRGNHQLSNAANNSISNQLCMNLWPLR